MEKEFLETVVPHHGTMLHFRETVFYSHGMSGFTGRSSGFKSVDIEPCSYLDVNSRGAEKRRVPRLLLPFLICDIITY
jgi:hypothetical protein